MFIQTEDTPNPNALKFIPTGCEVLGEGKGKLFFESERETALSPLAAALFDVKGVKSVLLARDFITVAKGDEDNWEALRPLLLAAIMDALTMGVPPLLEGEAGPSVGEEDEVVRQIREILELRIKPQLAADGGDVVFHAFEDGVVYVGLRGACAGCPGATITLKQGIESLLKYYVPEVERVVAAKP